MTCRIITTNQALYSVWGEPSLDDVAYLEEQLRLHAQKCGGPVLYVTRVPTNAPAPSAAVRRRIDATMPRVVSYCSTYHVVLEGVGFVAAMKRGVLVGLFQLAWRRGMYFVHSSIGEVVHSLPKDQRSIAEALFQKARAEGLLDTPVPKSLPPARGNAWGA